MRRLYLKQEKIIYRCLFNKEPADFKIYTSLHLQITFWPMTKYKKLENALPQFKRGIILNY